MKWKECLEEEVYKRKKDPEEARNLYKMAMIRKEDNQDRERTEEKAPLLVESHW